MLSRWVQALLVVIGAAMLLLALRGTASLGEDACAVRPATPPCGPGSCPDGWACSVAPDQLAFTCRAPGQRPQQTVPAVPSPASNPEPTPVSPAALAPAPTPSPAASPVADAPAAQFCPSFVPRVATGGYSLGTTCAAELRPYRDCEFLGAGHFGMGVRCRSGASLVVVKVRYHERAGTIRNAVKEALVGCQTSLLPAAGVADTFVALHHFLWCNSSSAAAFLHGIDVRKANTSIAETQNMLKRMVSPTSTITFVMLESVQVPDSFAHTWEGWVDAPMLMEVFYSIIVCNLILDYSVEDLRLHHLGWVDVPFHRHYSTSSASPVAVLLPPGRMLKLIDVGSYRTRHFNFTVARGVLSTAFYFTMFGKRDRIKQLDEDAKALFRYSSSPAVTTLPPVAALEAVMKRLRELGPQYSPPDPLPPNVRQYRVPEVVVARRIAGTWADVRDYDWKAIPLTLRPGRNGTRKVLVPVADDT